MIGILVRRREQTENKAVQQTDLRTRCTPARLTFADHMDRPVAGDRTPGTPKRAEMLTRVDPPLDCTVALFQDVIEVRHRPVPAAGVQRSFTLELSDRGWVSGVTVGVDDPGSGVILPTQRSGEETLCCGRSLLGREEKVEGRAGGVDSPVEVAPLAFDPYVGFVDAPTIACRLEVSA
jgi:hypothetical protein